MKVLLCHNFYQRPGGEDQVFHDERALLEEHGHDVTIYTKHNDDLHNVSLVRIATDTFWNPSVYRELRDLIRWLRPDVMHCTNIFPQISPAAYAAAGSMRVPVIQSLHNYRLHCANGYFLRDGQACEKCVHQVIPWGAVQYKCYRDSRAASAVVAGMQLLHRSLGTWRNRVDRFISCSEFAKQKLVARGIPAERVVVKPNFVRPDTGPGRGAGDYVVFVGRLSPEKGIGTLLDAWARLGEPWKLKIIGDGPLASAVAEAQQRDRRIEWLGWLSLEKVLGIVGEASCLIMPSIWYETFGRTLIEAFSKGTPVIASRLGAMAELVAEGQTGWLFEPGNPADLIEKFKQLPGEPGQRRAMRNRCREEFENRYTAEENYRQLMQIYHEALGHSVMQHDDERSFATV